MKENTCSIAKPEGIVTFVHSDKIWPYHAFCRLMKTLCEKACLCKILCIDMGGRVNLQICWSIFQISFLIKFLRGDKEPARISKYAVQTAS